jgi:hypothetical protein
VINAKAKHYVTNAIIWNIKLRAYNNAGTWYSISLELDQNKEK